MDETNSATSPNETIDSASLGDRIAEMSVQLSDLTELVSNLPSDDSNVIPLPIIVSVVGIAGTILGILTKHFYDRASQDRQHRIEKYNLSLEKSISAHEELMVLATKLKFPSFLKSESSMYEFSEEVSTFSNRYFYLIDDDINHELQYIYTLIAAIKVAIDEYPNAEDRLEESPFYSEFQKVGSNIKASAQKFFHKHIHLDEIVGTGVTDDEALRRRATKTLNERGFNTFAYIRDKKAAEEAPDKSD